MRVLICGDRYFRDAKRIFHYLSQVPADTIIIEGEARGADTIVWVCCEILGLKYMQFPADWSAYHKAAGVIRNQAMLEEGNPDLVLFYHDNLDNSRGTIDMITRAANAKIAVDEGPEYDKDEYFKMEWFQSSSKQEELIKNYHFRTRYNTGPFKPTYDIQGLSS